MSGTKVFEDSYCGVFTKQDEFLKCLESIGRNSFWERKKSKNLRLVPITDDSRVAEELPSGNGRNLKTCVWCPSLMTAG